MFNKVEVTNVTVHELARLISEQVKSDFINFNSLLKDIDPCENKPHMTLVETANFFSISKACLHDWVKQELLIPRKISGRVFFIKEDCIKLLIDKKAVLYTS